MNPSDLVRNLEEQKASLEIKCNTLEEALSKSVANYNKCKMQLRMEKIKSNLFANIIDTHTQLKVEDLYKETEDGVSIYNYEGGNVPLIVHDILGEPKKYIVTVRKKTVESGKVFRSAKNKVEIMDENPVEQEEKIKKIDDDIEEIKNENFDVSISDTHTEIETIFVDVKKNRVYKKSLGELKNLRSKLLGKLNLTDYIKLIQTHVKRLEKVFGDKGYDKKKQISFITLALSPLEHRLVFYGQYYDKYLETDELQKLRLSLKVNANYPKRYIPYNHTEIIPKLYNYTLTLFPLNFVLKNVFNNRYGFPNVVYLDLDNNNDPFSFYTLDKIETNGKRHWKMECRLDDFSQHIAIHLTTYCVTLFRQIYHDAFHDNVYRDDYQNACFIMHNDQDCEQLIANIILLSQPKLFCQTLQEIISSFCVISPTSLDSFNFTADDRSHKKQFSSKNDKDEDITCAIKRVFDEISNEKAIAFWQSKKLI